MDRAHSVFEQGRRLYLQGDLAGALDCCEKALARDADFVHAWAGKGLALRGLDEPQKALDAYKEALARDADFVHAWAGKGLALCDLDEPRKALDAYKEALARDADYVHAWAGKGEALYDLDKPRKALDAYEEALARDADYVPAWVGKGNALHDLDKPQKALDAYEEALARDADFVHAWAGKGLALCDLDEPRKALDAYEEALARDADHVPAWNGKGNALHDLDKPQKALDAYEEALARDADIVPAWNGKGNALHDLDEPRKALKAYRQCIRIDPHYSSAWFNLGLLYKDPDAYDAPGMARNAFIRSIHLASIQGKLKGNALRAIQDMGTAPLLVVRTYQEHGALDLLIREPKRYTEAKAQSERFLERQTLFARDDSLPETFRLAALGLEALELGDPVWASQLFSTFVETVPENLFAHYYLALSRFTFREIGATEEGLDTARPHAEATLKALDNGKPVRAKQLYYAGLILSMDLSGSIVPGRSPDSKDYQKARRCLEAAVARGWHPARFVLIDVLDACEDEEAFDAAIEDLLDAERKLHAGGRIGFLRGVPYSRRSWDDLVEAAADPPTGTYDIAGYPVFDGHDPWELPGRARATYTEIADALPFIYLWLHGPEDEPQDLPEDLAFVDLHPDVDPQAYREGWERLDEQSAWMADRRNKVTAREIDRLREELASEVGSLFYKRRLDPNELSASADRAELEERLAEDIEGDRKGKQIDTLLKLIRYFYLQDVLPERSAIHLAAYYGVCHESQLRHDRERVAWGGVTGYVLGKVLGRASTYAGLLFGASVVGLAGPVLAFSGSALTHFIVNRLVSSSESLGRCSYREFKTRFYDELLNLRPDARNQLEEHGLWDPGYEKDMDQLDW
jgi:tetratricopeptide (TPR) repeat protein